MGRLLISKRSVRSNEAIRKIQKEYISNHKQVKSKYPKAKLGKIVKAVDDNIIDCSLIKEKFDHQKGTLEMFSKESIIEKIEKANIKGLSGSGFPIIEKIKSVQNAEVTHKYLIVNGVACDPGLIHDTWLAREKSKEINMGIQILNKLISFKEVIIATPDILPCRYPMGEERVLIKQLLGVELSKNEVPSEKGYLVCNIQTVYAIYTAFFDEKELKTRYITIANLETGAASVAKVNLGQSVGEILENPIVDQKLDIKKFIKGSDSVYVGMGSMEADLYSKDMTISEKTGFIGLGSAAEYDNGAKCKKCGACSKKCPMGVDVKRMINAIEKGDFANLQAYGIDKCIHCGTCSYYCRAGKNTMEIMMKREDSK